MKKRLIVAVLFAVVFFLGVGTAFADYQAKIRDQQYRIDQGISSGRLTRAEASILQDNLNVIKVKLARFRSDGYVSPRERAELDRLLDRNSAMIYKKKHNVMSFYDSDFQDRISEQQRRIDQGIASGKLNRREASILQDNLNWIKSRFAKLRADGMLTRRERRNLDKMLEDNSAMIYQKKHNAVRRLY